MKSYAARHVDTRYLDLLEALTHCPRTIEQAKYFLEYTAIRQIHEAEFIKWTSKSKNTYTITVAGEEFFHYAQHKNLTFTSAKNNYLVFKGKPPGRWSHTFMVLCNSFFGHYISRGNLLIAKNFSTGDEAAFCAKALTNAGLANVNDLTKSQIEKLVEIVTMYNGTVFRNITHPQTKEFYCRDY